MRWLALVCASATGCLDVGEPEINDIVFADLSAEDFALGNHFSTRHDGTGVVPDAPAGGIYTSQVFDAGNPATTWLTLQWVPSDAYGLPLPDGNSADNGYSRGNVDMSDSALVIHCEGSVADSSAAQLEVAALAGSVVELDQGVLGEGCSMTGGDYFGVLVDDGSPLDFGDSDYTWAMWVRTSTDCDGNDVFMGIDQDVGATTGSHQWLGCAIGSDAVGPACGATLTGALAGAHRTVQSEGGGELCSNTAINDNQWHHLAITKSGHPDYTLRAYVDGREEDSTTGVYTAAMDYSGARLMFGRFPESGFETQGPARSDEIAVWRRALTDDELDAVVLRGGTDVRISVRSCAEPRCDDADFGPAIRDPGAGQPPDAIELEVPPNRYFQYRIELDNELDGLLPRFESVTVTAQ